MEITDVNILVRKFRAKCPPLLSGPACQVSCQVLQQRNAIYYRDLKIELRVENYVSIAHSVPTFLAKTDQQESCVHQSWRTMVRSVVKRQ